MKPSTKRYLIAITILTVICAAVLFLWNNRMPETMQFPHGFILLGIFALVVTAVHFFLLNITQTAPNAFVRAFMVSTAIKLMLYMTVLIAFLLYTKDNKKVLVLHFLFYYAVFTVLEVGMLYKELVNQKKAGIKS